MRLEIIFPGKTREKYINAGIDDFNKRLGHYVKVDCKVIKDRAGSGDPVRAKKIEGDKLLESCAKSAFIVALDPAGKQVSSEKLSRMVETWEMQGRQVVSFIIGGADGLASAVTERADFILSMSKMTFTHEMARLLLLEQLYRAYNIKAGTKYHK